MIAALKVSVAILVTGVSAWVFLALLALLLSGEAGASALLRAPPRLVRASSVAEIQHVLRTEVKRACGDHVWSLLDVGCGIRPQKVVPVARCHLGLDAFLPYAVKSSIPTLIHDVRKGLPFPFRSFDVVWLGDVIEHLDKDDGWSLFREAKRVAARGVVVLSPLGFCAQEGDAWGLGGDEWQRHRSGWTPEELGAEVAAVVPAGVNCATEWFGAWVPVRHA